MPRIAQQPAYVLHTRAYRESSLLLELLTRDHGRIALVARGARGQKSRWRNQLQAFRPLLTGWSSRGDLGTLTAAEQIAAPPVLRGESLYCGLYLNELLIRLLHRSDPHPEVFERYRHVLAELSSGQALQPALRLFEKHLLDSIGFGLSLEYEHGGQCPIEAGAWYSFEPGKGARLLPPVLDSTARQASAQAFKGAALLALATEQIGSEDLPDLRRLMRRVFRYHLGDKPMASLALFKSHGRAQDARAAKPDANHTHQG